jgi:predicted transcriptional regulator
MSNQPVSTSDSPSAHVPIALLGVALSIFLFAQIRQSSATSETLKKNITNAEESSKTLKNNEKQVSEMNAKNEPTMKQAKALFEEQQKFLNDVLELAKDDDNAKRVVAAHGIAKSGPDAPAATPAPAAPAAPEKK